MAETKIPAVPVKTPFFNTPLIDVRLLERFADELAKGRDPREACRSAVLAANAKQGSDITRTWMIYFEKRWGGGGGGSPAVGPWELTLGMAMGDAPQTIAGPTTAYPPGPPTAPRRIQYAGTLIEVEIASNIPGTGTIYVDILKTRDQGATWVSIFPAGNENKLVLSAGSTLPNTRVTAFAAPPDDMFEVDDFVVPALLAGSSEDWRNIIAHVRWA